MTKSIDDLFLENDRLRWDNDKLRGENANLRASVKSLVERNAELEENLVRGYRFPIEVRAVESRMADYIVEWRLEAIRYAIRLPHYKDSKEEVIDFMYKHRKKIYRDVLKRFRKEIMANFERWAKGY